MLEGQWQPSRLVLFRFSDRAAVRAFMNDTDTLPFKALRQRVADTDSVVVDGL